MKNYKLHILIIGLILSKIMVIPGFVNFLLSIVTKAELQYNYWWIVSAIGLILSVAGLILLLLIIFKKRQPARTMSSQSRSAYLRQIFFSFVNIGMSLGVGLFSTIVALYALNNAIDATNVSNGTLTESLLRKANLLNIVAIILIGIQWLTLAIFVGSIHQAGLNL